ncbi:hypothetical protein ACM39_18560 [Chryseobacterium sp. FH2]|uniref:hypothetical protein n=1 Tax=Chryseobacterium sp. FH2 TaxID=1674291 RepID=UPI00065AAF49|nr:hypothetical protein [Chryseobacterium sp. FH2]KMQ58730.1 hypothetical protein ACM39_18560 [Chryseobacterium sp. FH2]
MMKFKYCIFLVVLFGWFYGQNNSNDSLRKYTYSELEKKFYKYYNSEHITESILLSNYYLQKAKAEKNKIQVAE